MNPPWNIESPEERKMALQWLQAHLALISDGGVWMIPRSVTLYVVDKRRKVLIRRWGLGDPSTEKLAKELGWKIETGKE